MNIKKISNKDGFTLVELLVVLMIILILIIVMVATINPGALMNKGKDTQIKKDLSRISVVFEEYYNDKNCFPDQTIVDSLMEKANCSKTIMSPWLERWPCGPGQTPYIVVVDQQVCPKWYKVMANLRNKSDKDIPVGWYDVNKNITGGYTNMDVNYGVSSQNILWSD